MRHQHEDLPEILTQQNRVGVQTWYTKLLVYIAIKFLVQSLPQ